MPLVYLGVSFRGLIVKGEKCKTPVPNYPRKQAVVFAGGPLAFSDL